MTAAPILTIVALVLTIVSCNVMTWTAEGNIYRLPQIVLVSNIVAMVLYQVPWCWKAGKGYLIAAGCVAILAGIANLACYSYTITLMWQQIPYARRDLIMGILSGVIWFVPSILVFWFVGSGRQAAVGNSDDDGDIEEAVKPVGKAADDSAESEENDA